LRRWSTFGVDGQNKTKIFLLKVIISIERNRTRWAQGNELWVRQDLKGSTHSLLKVAYCPNIQLDAVRIWRMAPQVRIERIPAKIQTWYLYKKSLQRYLVIPIVDTAN
jgi:hypothetical protein